MEKSAVLLILRKILVSLTEELSSNSMLLALPQTDASFSRSCWVHLSEGRSVSGCGLSETWGTGFYYVFVIICKQQPMGTKNIEVQKSIIKRQASNNISVQL